MKVILLTFSTAFDGPRTREKATCSTPTTKTTFDPMEPLDVTLVQAQLVRCQEILDTSRQEGWSPELVNAFYDATRALHEGAVVRHALAAQATPFLSDNSEMALQENAGEDAPPVNRLLTPEELGNDSPSDQTQVDLLSSIGEMTLAEKLALQPLSHVADGMSIVDRAQFTSVLFSGEEEVFSTLLAKLSRASTQEEALALFQEALAPRGTEDEIAGLKDEFAKRIMRTFVT